MHKTQKELGITCRSFVLSYLFKIGLFESFLKDLLFVSEWSEGFAVIF